MNQSDDALEVAQVLGNKLRPLYTFAAVVIGILGVGVTHVWNLAEFINRDAVHEKQQDDNLLTMQRRLNKHDEELDKARARNLATIKLLINDLALLRAVQLETLKPRKREQVRKDFERQRMQSIDLLVTAQQ